MSEKEKNKQFQNLIEQHKGILFKVARAYCQQEEDRQDLIQEIKIQIWRSLDKYNDKYQISTWLYRISLNVAISFYRKNAKRHANTISLNEQVSEIKEIDNTEKEEQLKQLMSFIYKLNNLDKALMLLYLESKTHIEIADILGTSKSNVGTKIGRIKEKMKTHFLQKK
jgi:RNA polymerase sigma-70 factor (ECF subfamily)